LFIERPESQATDEQSKHIGQNAERWKHMLLGFMPSRVVVIDRIPQTISISVEPSNPERTQPISREKTPECGTVDPMAIAQMIEPGNSVTPLPTECQHG
jgi:hypothetical protein